MAYTLEEQETIIRYDKFDKAWYYETNINEHIKRILKNADDYTITNKEEEDGRIIWIEAKVDNLDDYRINPWPKKRRKMTEEQRQALAERLKRVSS